MTHKLYASYGVLAHEKQPVYTDGLPASDIYDIVTVDLPAGVYILHHAAGGTLVDIDGQVYFLNDILSTDDQDQPILTWFDGRENHVITLSIIEEG